MQASSALWTRCASGTSRSRRVARCTALRRGCVSAANMLLTLLRCAAQVYAEASRRVATYGTWGLLAVNTVLFLGTQLVVEPSKRRRAEASMRSAVTEQGDRILSGLPAVAVAPQHGSAAASDARQTALLGALHAMDVRQRQAEAVMAARLDALTSARSSDAVTAAVPPKPAPKPAPWLEAEHPVPLRERALMLRFALASAWAALPPGPLTGSRGEWVAGVAGCAAAGGLVSGGLLLAALGAAGR
jgi:hypothetical protein